MKLAKDIPQDRKDDIQMQFSQSIETIRNKVNEL